MIKFGTGFDEIEVLLGKAPYVIVKTAPPEVAEPAAEYNLDCKHDFPAIKKRKIRETPVRSVAPVPVKSAIPVKNRVVTPTATGFAIIAPTVPSAKGKEIQLEEDSVDVFAPPPSVFEVGSSSRIVPLTKSQRRNRNRKVMKARRAEAAKLALTEATPQPEETEVPETSPLLRGSRFHPLSATTGEESIYRIAAALPPPHGHGEEKEKSTPLTRVRSVFEKLAEKERCSVAKLLKRMGCAVSPRMKTEILKKDKSVKQFQKSAEAPPSRIPAKLRLGVRTDTVATVTHASTVVTRPTERRSVKSRLGPRVPPTAICEEPPRMNNGKRPFTTVYGPHTREHAFFQRADVATETSRLKTSTSRKKVWVSRVAGPVLPEKSGEHPLEMDHESDTPIVAVTAASEPITERKDLQEGKCRPISR